MKTINNVKHWRYIPKKNIEDAYENIIVELQNLGKNYLTSSAEQ